jgi:predicted AAA+ superfamily ATPase
MNTPYRRPVLATLVARLRERRARIQVLAGPRQVGKTTLARQALAELGVPASYVSADDPALRGAGWLDAQWEAARAQARGASRPTVLVVDEVQKVVGWPETVKRLWDEDTRHDVPLHVVLLGSSPLLLRTGLADLAGRFEILPIWHWSFTEMADAFGWDAERYVHFGGYPGGAALIEDEDRWAAYVRDTLIETTLARDVLLLTRVDKPALLRQLFGLACAYSGQIVAYQKLVAQLQDAGNATTIAHYLDVLAGAGLVGGLQKYSGSRVRQRASSPKLQVLNTALIAATTGSTFTGTRADPVAWGRAVESAIGAHLVALLGVDNVLYWRERDAEVDYVVRVGRDAVAVEVTTSARKSTAGLDALRAAHARVRPLIVGAQGMTLEDVLRSDRRALFGR